MGVLAQSMLKLFHFVEILVEQMVDIAVRPFARVCSH